MDISSLRERSGTGLMSVSELNLFIKNMFDGNRLLTGVSVTGEISNFTAHKSGHLYFSVKDSEAQIRAVMFRSSAAGLKFRPENGMKVILRGSVSVFVRDGAYQLYVTSMQPDGVGALYLAYEQMKERLGKEGLFDDIHKKPIPRYPERIGVITSPTGAAVRDIINVLGRRYPLATVYLYPAIVQGDFAEETLVKGIDFFDKSHLVDTVIIGRGGGSAEDLWCFNDETLARTIAESGIPVISAVGHETDFTICDFVSDLRAPTPSAAAELAFPDTMEILNRVKTLNIKNENALSRKISKIQNELELMKKNVELHSPVRRLGERESTLAILKNKLDTAQRSRLEALESEFRMLCTRLEASNPLSVLSHGYSVVEDTAGRLISSAGEVKVGEAITVKLQDGEISATVTDTRMKKEIEGK